MYVSRHVFENGMVLFSLYDYFSNEEIVSGNSKTGENFKIGYKEFMDRVENYK